MAKSFKLTNLWNAQSLKINDSTVAATGIISSLDGVATNSTALVTAGAIKSELNSINNAKLTYVYVEGPVPSTGLVENTIYIVKDPNQTTGSNLCTEYLCYNDGTKLTLEKIGEVGFDYTAVHQEIVDLQTALGGAYDKDNTVESAIADAKKAGTDAQADVDALEKAIGGAYDKDNTVASAIANAQSAADAAQDGVDELNAVLGDGFSKDSTVTDQLSAVEGIAGTALQDVVTDPAGSNGIILTLAKTGDKKVSPTLTVTPATLDETTKTYAEGVTGFALATDVQAAINAKAAESGIHAVTSSADLAAEIPVKVAFAAKADDATTLETTVTVQSATSTNKGVVTLSDAVDSTSGTAAGVAATPAAVKTVADYIGVLTSLTTKDKTNAVAAINELVDSIGDVKDIADTAIQAVEGDSSKAVKVTFAPKSETDKTTLTTTVSVSTASTTTTEGKTVIDTTTEGALVTAKTAQDAIDAAEARATAVGSYTAGNGITITDKAIAVKPADLTGAVAADVTGWTTGGAVHTAIEGAKTALTGTESVTATTKTITKAIALAEAAQETAAAKVASIAGSDHITAAPTSETDHTAYTISVKEGSVLDMIIKAINTASKTADGNNTTEAKLAERLGKLFQLADNLDVEPE